MFRIVCDPSSGNTELCLTEITLSILQIFFLCLNGVWQRNFEPAVCVQPVVPCTHTAGSKLRCQTPTKHTKNIREPPRVISVKHSSVLPDDGSHTMFSARYDGLGNISQPVAPCTHTAGSKLRCQTPTKHTKNICEPPRVISVKHISVIPDDGSYTIRNMLE